MSRPLQTRPLHGSVPPLFAGLFDDAALFPPGNAPMPSAVTAHGEYAKAWYAKLVGLFVCPADRLTELDRSVQEFPFRGSGISITVPGGISALDSALHTARSHNWMNIAAIEIPVPTAELATGLAALNATAVQGVSVFVEIALPDVTGELCRELRQAGLGLKLRTGGTTPAAFPSAVTLGAAIEAAVVSGVRFKCTAGLHNAIAHHDPATGFDHHGFLNVLLGILDSATGVGAASVLAERDSAVVIGRVHSIDAADAGQIRSSFASIGSCSIAEPLTDLDKAGLVTAP